MPSVQNNGKAPPRQEVEAWLDRIDDITAAVQDILSECPVESERMRQEREAERRRIEMEKKREKIKMRYDPRYYARFEREEVIDALLKQADNVGSKSQREPGGDKSLYSRVERVSLDEALRLKDEAAKAVKACDWERAMELYTTAITLNVVDTALQCTLYNNRALVQIKLRCYIDAVNDASYVLHEQPMNVKALLRRATALKHLHRPLDALRDAEAALMRDPASQEAAGLAHWLRRAKKEHISCVDFQHCHPEEAKQLVEAVNIFGAAVKTLQGCGFTESDRGDGKNASEGDIDQGGMLQATRSLYQCLVVVQSFHRGAAVLFSLCEGVRPLKELISELLSGSVLENSGADSGASQGWVATRGMAFFASLRLMTLVLQGSETSASELDSASVEGFVGSLVVTLTRLMQEGHWINRSNMMVTPAVSILEVLGGLAVRFPVQVYAQCGSVLTEILDAIIKQQPVASNHLFFYCKLLEALLMDASVSVAVPKDLYGLLPHVIRTALTVGLGQLEEIGLSLALRASCISSAWAKAMSTLEFTRLLARTYESSSQKAQRDSPSLRAKEALYAVVYNIFLQAESKPRYVAQWRAATETTEGDDATFAICTWCALRDGVMSKEVSREHMVPLARMMGVVAKFAPYDEALWAAMLVGEGMLWSMLESALPVLQPRANGSLTQDDEDETLVMAAWGIVEHSTTCVASFYAQNLLSREEGLMVPGRIAVLLRIIELAGDQHMIALGNAALITSFVPPPVCEHYATLKAVEVLLEALRGVRTAICALEHEGKNGATQWTHARTTQKNIAIALSRWCTVESQRERLRELRGFETLHAILEQTT